MILKHKRSLFCVKLLLIMVLLAITVPSAVAEIPDLTHTVHLTIDYHSGDQALPNAAFHLYKVAELSSSAHFTPTASFRDAGVSFDQIGSQQDWRETASVLSTYIAAKGIAPLYSAVTNTEGQAFLSLSAGLYLVSGEELEHASHLYTPETALISLPNFVSDTWQYDVTMHPKPEITPVPLTQLRVIKIWNDSQNTSLRPEKLKVELLCNGETFETVVLNKANGWSYQWHHLDGRNQWSAREAAIPDGYTAKTQRLGDRIIITNSLTGTPEPPEENLPQTGLTWWPVPVLALSGMGLFLYGWIKERQKR